MTLNAVITGGGKGIGLAVARRLKAEGVSVSLLGRDEAALSHAAGELGARYAVADVADYAALRAAISQFGPCDILVNNAGGTLQAVHAAQRR